MAAQTQAKAQPKKTKGDEFVATLIRNHALDLGTMIDELYVEDCCNGFEDLAEPVVEKGTKLSEAELFNALQNNKAIQSSIKKFLKKLTNHISKYASNEFRFIIENREEAEREMEWELEDQREEDRAMKAEREKADKELRKEAAKKAILKDSALTKKEKAKAKKAFGGKTIWW